MCYFLFSFTELFSKFQNIFGKTYTDVFNK